MNFSKMMMQNPGFKPSANANVPIEEATHGEDCFYLLKTLFTQPVKIPSKEFDVVKRMVGLLSIGVSLHNFQLCLFYTMTMKEDRF
jgi:hypothetical protein